MPCSDAQAVEESTTEQAELLVCHEKVASEEKRAADLEEEASACADKFQQVLLAILRCAGEMSVLPGRVQPGQNEDGSDRGCSCPRKCNSSSCYCGGCRDRSIFQQPFVLGVIWRCDDRLLRRLHNRSSFVCRPQESAMPTLSCKRSGLMCSESKQSSRFL